MVRWKSLPLLLAASALLLAGGAYLLPRAAAAREGAYLAADKDAPKEAPPTDEPRLRAATEAERKAAIASIEAQLKAFRDDDYAKAEKYQHSSLRRNFDAPGQFRRMMREAYPQFANYKSATFGDAKCDEKGETLVIPVSVTGQDRLTVRAVYMLLKEDGEYRVAGVTGGIARKADPRNIL